MNNTIRQILIVSLLLVLVPLYWATTAPTERYVATTGVDSGNCSSIGSPCALVSYAITQSACGDNINIRAGTYTQQTLLTSALGCSAGTPLTIRNYNGETVTFLTTSSTDRRIFSLKNTTYHYIIDGLTLKLNHVFNGTPFVNNMAFEISGANFVTIKNTSFDGANLGQTAHSSFLSIKNSNDITYQDNSMFDMIDDATVFPVSSRNDQHGILISSSPSQRVLIQRSTFTNLGGDGVQCIAGSCGDLINGSLTNAVTVEDCTFTCSLPLDGSKGNCENAWDIKSPANFLGQRNYATGFKPSESDPNGVAFAISNGVAPLSGYVKFTDNKDYNNSVGVQLSGTQNGLKVEVLRHLTIAPTTVGMTGFPVSKGECWRQAGNGATDSSWYHNTCVSPAVTGLFIQNNHTLFNFRNNIVYNPGTYFIYQTGQNGLLCQTASTSDCTVDTNKAVLTHNLFFGTSKLVRWLNTVGAAVSQSLSSFITASGNATSGQTGDPVFVNNTGNQNGDYNIQTSSPAKDTGVAITGINDGFIGSAPDIGKYEFNPAPPGTPSVLDVQWTTTANPPCTDANTDKICDSDNAPNSLTTVTKGTTYIRWTKTSKPSGAANITNVRSWFRDTDYTIPVGQENAPTAHYNSLLRVAHNLLNSGTTYLSFYQDNQSAGTFIGGSDFTFDTTGLVDDNPTFASANVYCVDSPSCTKNWYGVKMAIGNTFPEGAIADEAAVKDDTNVVSPVFSEQVVTVNNAAGTAAPTIGTTSVNSVSVNCSATSRIHLEYTDSPTSNRPDVSFAYTKDGAASISATSFTRLNSTQSYSGGTGASPITVSDVNFPFGYSLWEITVQDSANKIATLQCGFIRETHYGARIQ